MERHRSFRWRREFRGEKRNARAREPAREPQYLSSLQEHPIGL
jgi:hypothetical protein